jgi:hypothetical protein
MRAFVGGKVLESRPLTRRGGAAVLASDGEPMFLTKLFDGVGEVFEVVGMESGGAVGEEVALVVQVNLRDYNGGKQLSLWLEGRIPALPAFVRAARAGGGAAAGRAVPVPTVNGSAALAGR